MASRSDATAIRTDLNEKVGASKTSFDAVRPRANPAQNPDGASATVNIRMWKPPSPPRRT
jgi:hypothetical protein